MLLALPALTNDFVAQVMMLVCLYTLMGLGLNIELGLAGLVDLGFVAFFAVGAYTVALLTAGHAGGAGPISASSPPCPSRAVRRLAPASCSACRC